jgi:glycosyltransferase involved in cell wall biosynthesis
MSIYSPPEYYPPLLNAVQELSPIMEEIVIITRNIKVKAWAFPPNVKLIRVGKEKSMEETLSMSPVKKAKQFFAFINSIRNENRRKKTDVWQANDSIPLFAFFILLLTGTKKPGILWYHNHDIAEISMYGKYSVGWMAAIFEKKALPKVNLFTIPAKDRLSNFDLSALKGQWFVVPNYPSLKSFTQPVLKTHKHPKELKLIYQGSLGEHHGFEELISCLKSMESEYTVILTLIGPISEKYKQKLIALADANNVTNHFCILAPVPYDELNRITTQHDVGLAIHKPVGHIYNTGGTASNKIYEYAANGLPVILYDNNHYREHLSKFEWAFFTDCSCKSFYEAFDSIYKDYKRLSVASRNDFESNVNFETAFSPVIDFFQKAKQFN